MYFDTQYSLNQYDADVRLRRLIIGNVRWLFLEIQFVEIEK